MRRLPPRSTLTDTLFPYTTLFRSCFDAVERTGYADMWRQSRADGASDRVENLAELVNIVGTFDTVEELFEHAALAGREQNGSETGSVRLMTMHRAKGMEFPHVFLPAWEEGVFPSVRSEERRVGTECVHQVRFWGAPYNYKKQ